MVGTWLRTLSRNSNAVQLPDPCAPKSNKLVTGNNEMEIRWRKMILLAINILRATLISSTST